MVLFEAMNALAWLANWFSRTTEMALITLGTTSTTTTKAIDHARRFVFVDCSSTTG